MHFTNRFGDTRLSSQIPFHFDSLTKQRFFSTTIHFYSFPTGNRATKIPWAVGVPGFFFASTAFLVGLDQYCLPVCVFPHLWYACAKMGLAVVTHASHLSVLITFAFAQFRTTHLRMRGWGQRTSGSGKERKSLVRVGLWLATRQTLKNIMMNLIYVRLTSSHKTAVSTWPKVFTLSNTRLPPIILLLSFVFYSSLPLYCIYTYHPLKYQPKSLLREKLSKILRKPNLSQKNNEIKLITNHLIFLRT